MRILLVILLCLFVMSVAGCERHPSKKSNVKMTEYDDFFIGNHIPEPPKEIFYLNEDLLPDEYHTDTRFEYITKPLDSIEINYKDNISKLQNIKRIYGEPSLIDTTMVYNGRFDSTDTYYPSVSILLEDIPKCQVIEYEWWSVVDENNLYLYFVRTKRGWILIDGYMIDIAQYPYE